MVWTPPGCSTWLEEMIRTHRRLKSLGERRSKVQEYLLERKMEKVFDILAWKVRLLSRFLFTNLPMGLPSEVSVCQKVESKGRTTYNEAEGMQVRGRIARKTAYLQERQAQVLWKMTGLQNLVSHNERLYRGTNSVPAGGSALPFILVQTGPQATVEVEISEDMQVVHFDFNSLLQHTF